MKRFLHYASIFAVVLWAGFPSAIAQNKASVRPAAETIMSPESVSTDEPRFFYEFTQPQFDVHHILVEHDARGSGRISFERKNIREVVSEPIELSPVVLKRIAGLWESLRFLENGSNYQSNKQFPHLGTVNLRVQKKAGEEHEAEFNWTNNEDASALATEYRRIADQAMFVFDIAIARENQPLEATRVLNGLESLVSRKALSDAEQLLPLLRDLHTDERIPLMARNQALRLAKKIEKKR